MKFNVDIMSSQMVKPTTPTPNHAKIYKLSLFDQFYKFTYVPHILFYKHDSHTTQMSTIELLRDSLSQSLSLYYPFAGRLTADESAVDCNDKGVSFVVARAHDCSITSFLEASNRVDYVGNFISRNYYDHSITSIINGNGNDNNEASDTKVSPVSSNVTKLILLTIQVTTFECGGVVIGSQWLHKVCDGATWGHFLKTWASFAAKRNEDVIHPDFETVSSFFPPRDEIVLSTEIKVRSLVPLDDIEATQEVDGLCIAKAFNFSSEAISALKVKGASDEVPNPTRIEAVSGFIWKHAMSAAARASSSSAAILGPSVLAHAVNIRPRLNPPLPSTTFGNLLIDTIARYEGDTQTNPNLQYLVHQIRKSLSMAKDAKFLNKFQGKQGGDLFCEYKQNLTDTFTDPNVTTTYKFTSWSKLNMDPNFGFGSPCWAAFTGGRLKRSFKNLVILTETCNGGNRGIEAWLILDEQEMDILQVDDSFLKFASLHREINSETTP